LSVNSIAMYVVKETLSVCEWVFVLQQKWCSLVVPLHLWQQNEDTERTASEKNGSVAANCEQTQRRQADRPPSDTKFSLFLLQAPSRQHHYDIQATCILCMYAPLSMRSWFVALVQALFNNMYVNTKSPARLFSSLKCRIVFRSATRLHGEGQRHVACAVVHFRKCMRQQYITHFSIEKKEREKSTFYSPPVVFCGMTFVPQWRLVSSDEVSPGQDSSAIITCMHMHGADAIRAIAWMLRLMCVCMCATDSNIPHGIVLYGMG
jgi:hypothetical protein